VGLIAAMTVFSIRMDSRMMGSILIPKEPQF
jgi:hypothetical protein